MGRDANVIAANALSAHSAQQTRCPLTRASEASYIARDAACVASKLDGLTFTGDFHMAKVQGEGDYESARRYNSKTRSFVKKAGKAATKRASGGVDEGALRKAKSRSKGGKQDAKDADLLRTLAARKGKKSAGAARSRAR